MTQQRKGMSDWWKMSTGTTVTNTLPAHVNYQGMVHWHKQYQCTMQTKQH